MFLGAFSNFHLPFLFLDISSTLRTQIMSITDRKAPATLIARYSSPKGTKGFSHPLNASSTSMPVEEKTAYLSGLRSSVIKLQEEVNVFLTQEMEHDKAALVEGEGEVDYNKDEENYGEEVMDKDEVTEST